MISRSVRVALYERLYLDLGPLLPVGILPMSPDGAFGELPPDARVNQVAAKFLATSLVKKFQDEIDEVRTSLVTWNKFQEMNAMCASPPFLRLNTASLRNDGALEDDFNVELFNTFVFCFQRFWGSPILEASEFARCEPNFDWEHFLSAAKVSYFANTGNGSTIGAHGTSFLEKFGMSELTYSSEFAKRLMVNKAATDPRWADLEISRYLADLGFEKVDASRFTVVPKTVNEGRGVCAEPTVDAYFQQGVRLLLTEQLRAYYGIDFTHMPEHNAELARLGSIYGSFGTIDSTSASDTISKELVSRLLPPRDYSLLDSLQTDRITYCRPDNKESETIERNIFSTMGCAFTFPLQTAIFAAAVEAVYKMLSLPFNGKCGITWGVFGDDVVVLTKAYDTVARLLRLIGFLPNLDKSFNQGYFRESCGSDWYNGTNVRGVYCKTLKTLQDKYSLINRLMDWSVRHDIALPETFAFLRGRCKIWLRVPMHEADDRGIKTPSSLVRQTTHHRQSIVRGWGVIPYYAFVPEARNIETEDACESVLRLSFVKGELRDGKILIRSSERPRYRERLVFTPSWDAVPWVGGPWQHGLVPLKKDYLHRYITMQHRNGLV